MSRCDRWAREGLLAATRGEALDPHFETCPDCLAERAAIARLEARLAAPPAGPAGALDWEARTRARIARDRAVRRRMRFGLFGLFGAAAATTAVLLLMPRASGPITTGGPPGYAIERGPDVLRADQPRPGDRLRLEAPREGAAWLALRVYDGAGRYLGGCEGCEGEVARARVELPAPGRYRPVVVRAKAALPAPTGLDADAEAATRASGRLDLAPAVEVF